MFELLRKKLPKGSVLAAIYTCNPAEPDLDAQRRLVDLLVARNLGIYALGTTGQGEMMTLENRMQVAEVILTHTENRTPVIVHVGATDLDSACKLAAHAQELGADGISVKLPPGLSVQDGINYHARVANSASDLAFLPYFLGVAPNNIAEYFRALKSEIPTLAGTKLTSTDLWPLRLLANDASKELLIFAGADEMTVSAFYAGAHGAIGSTWNYWGQSAVAVWKQLAASRMNPQAALAYSTRLSSAISSILSRDPNHPQSSLYCFARTALLEEGIDIGQGLLPQTAASVEWAAEEVTPLLAQVTEGLT